MLVLKTISRLIHESEIKANNMVATARVCGRVKTKFLEEKLGLCTFFPSEAIAFCR